MNNLCHAVTEIAPPLYPLHRSVSLQFSRAFVLTPAMPLLCVRLHTAL